jgi:hypothetical protein
MGLKEELSQELESTRQNFHHLLDFVPEALYFHPSQTPRGQTATCYFTLLSV